MKVIAICPSKRPDMLKKMVDSFKSTIQGSTDLYIMKHDMTVTQCFNQALLENPKYDFYHLTNDDVIYKTMGWDKLLSVKGKISYGDDGIQGKALCTFPVIDGDIVRAVGYLQMRDICKYCGDSVWMEIGQYAKCLNYVDNVKIEHHHFINNKRKNDDPEYKEIYDYDIRMFWNWKANDSIKDIANVRRVLYGHPNYTKKWEGK